MQNFFVTNLQEAERGEMMLPHFAKEKREFCCVCLHCIVFIIPCCLFAVNWGGWFNSARCLARSADRSPDSKKHRLLEISYFPRLPPWNYPGPPFQSLPPFLHQMDSTKLSVRLANNAHTCKMNTHLKKIPLLF